MQDLKDIQIAVSKRKAPDKHEIDKGKSIKLNKKRNSLICSARITNLNMEW